MDERKLLACPECELFCSVEQNFLEYACPKCGGELKLVNIAYEAYESLSEEDKTEVREEYIKKHFGTAAKKIEAFQPLKQSGWVNFIGIMGAIAVALTIIAGALVTISGAFLVGAGIILAGLCGGGSMILFSIVAEDVRHIRNQIDRLILEKGKR